MYVVMLVGLGSFFLMGPYSLLFLMLLLTALLVLAFVETKNLILEQTGILFDGDSAKEPVVSAAQSSTHGSEEDEKRSQIFHEYIRD